MRNISILFNCQNFILETIFLIFYRYMKIKEYVQMSERLHSNHKKTERIYKYKGLYKTSNMDGLPLFVKSSELPQKKNRVYIKRYCSWLNFIKNLHVTKYLTRRQNYDHNSLLKTGKWDIWWVELVQWELNLQSKETKAVTSSNQNQTESHPIRIESIWITINILNRKHANIY